MSTRKDRSELSRETSRRKFLKSSAALVGGALGSQVSFPRTVSAAPGPIPDSPPMPKRPGMKKALKYGMIQVEGSVLDKFKLIKELGFDGVEPNSPSDLDRNEVLKARDATGIEIPGVVDSVHWRQTLGDPDPAVREAGRRGLETAIRDCKFYGGTSVLLVPAVVRKDVSYDEAYTRSQAEIRKVLPLAEELDIQIAFENVWNQFLLSPLEAARYVDEFENPPGRMALRRRQHRQFRMARALDQNPEQAHLQARHQGIQPREDESGGTQDRVPSSAARGGLRLAERHEGAGRHRLPRLGRG